MAKTIYVVGFAFSPAQNAVVLIRKTLTTDSNGNARPDWLQNKYNGVGTDLTDEQISNNTPLATVMRQTFNDRAGADVVEASWRAFHTIDNDSATVTFFAAVLDSMNWQRVRALTKEEIRKVNLNTLFDPTGNVNVNVVPNLKWLIPMALDTTHIGSISGNTYDTATSQQFTDFMEQYAAHMNPANLIPADKLQATPTTDSVTINLLTEIAVGNPDKEHLIAALLQAAIAQESHTRWIVVISEAFGIDKVQVARVVNVAADTIAGFSIDAATGIEKAKQAITDMLAMPPFAPPVQDTSATPISFTVPMAQVTARGSMVVETVPAVPPAEKKTKKGQDPKENAAKSGS